MSQLLKYALISALSLAAFLMLAGCDTTPKKPDAAGVALAKPVVKYVVVKPGPELLKDCEIYSKPPPTKAYLALSDIDKEIAMAEYARALMGELALCAKRPPLLREFFNEQARLYQSK